ncbi:MAG: hypothetical protein F6K56_17385 [Moorea sp. SIO3G5]|nr:hypothetical protein [Moorena sp. SIO3G5]
MYVCQLTFCKTILWVVLTGESSSELKVLAINAVIVVKTRTTVGHATRTHKSLTEMQRGLGEPVPPKRVPTGQTAVRTQVPHTDPCAMSNCRANPHSRLHQDSDLIQLVWINT